MPSQNTIDDPMLIACPNCSTSYMIDSAALGEAGRAVRCARCRTTWFADGRKSEMIAAMEVVGEEEGSSTAGVLRPDEMAAGTDSASTLADGPSIEEPLNGSAQSDSPAETPPLLADAPPIVPAAAPHGPDEETPATDPDEIENFSARRKRLQAKRKKARRSSRWTALVLVLFAFNVALLGARSEVVRFFPQTASLFSAIGLPVNLRNLKFENMRISKETQEGMPALVIEGTIASISNRPTEVPRLRFAARDASGQEVYTWSMLPSRSVIGPGEKLDFHSRFVSPPPNATDVMVRFFTSQDATPGTN